MQSKVSKKVAEYLKQFKEDIREQALKSSDTNTLLQYIFDYEPLTLTKEDFLKKIRVKTKLSPEIRCTAKKSSNEQCTRRRKANCEFCGTHVEKRPFGVVDDVEKPTTHKINVWVQEIKGILYHLDNFGNVYKQEDVMSNKMNPKIIAKYVKDGDTYSIPEFGI